MQYAIEHFKEIFTFQCRYTFVLNNVIEKLII